MKELKWDDEDVGRFMRMVDVLPCGCWFWTGARSRGKGNRKWYGTFHVKGHGSVRAHRFSDRALGGKPELEPGMHRDHGCSFSLCVNPAHLEHVTHERNQELKVERQRSFSAMARLQCPAAPP